MRRLAAAVTILWMAASAVLAVGAVAAPRGRITGRVIDGNTDRPAAGVRVSLISVKQDGSQPLTRTTIADERGRYKFARLPTGSDRLYGLDAAFDSGIFAGEPISIPSDTDVAPVIDTTLRVWPTTTDPATISISRDDVFVGLGRGGVGVIESLTIVNRTDRAYVGRGGGSEDGATPSLGIALPPGAQGFAVVDSDIEPRPIQTDFGFAATAAIPPGETRIQFTYTLQEGTVGSYALTRPALYPIVEFTVHATDGITVQSNRLSEIEPVTVGGREYARWSSSARIEAGDPIQIVALADAGRSAGLIAGIVAAVVLAVGLLAWGIARGRRKPLRQLGPNETRDDLLVEVASLDLDYGAGKLSEDEWSARRSQLKERIASSEAPTQ